MKSANIFFSLISGVSLSFTLQSQVIREPELPKMEEPKVTVISTDQPYFVEYPKPVNQPHQYGAAVKLPPVIRSDNGVHGNVPVYSRSIDQRSNQQASINYIRERMRNDPAYSPPSNANGYSNVAMRKQQAVRDLLNEVYADEQTRRFNPAYFQSPQWADRTKSYTDAMQLLKDQLSGKRKLSVADAYFAIEHAHGNSYLTKKEYDDVLDESAVFITQWMAQNGFDLNSNRAKHLAIQRFMGDTLQITVPSPDGNSPPVTKNHYPFFYDYEDFKGEKDHRNYFTTKCLATGGGQCNSLPATYLSLAGRLGATAYLSFAPFHSLIKYPDDNGIIHSYEPTSNTSFSDKRYEELLFISPEAKRSGIYLDTLNERQVVANCLLDLAFGYLKKHGAADGRFVKECVSVAMQEFPRQNNIYTYFIYSSYLARRIEGLLYANGITNLADIGKVPEATKLQEALIQNEEIIARLGYRDMPEDQYEHLMRQHDFKAERQEAEGRSGKEKRSLFITSY